MSSSKPFNLSQLYAELNKACNLLSYEKVSNISTEILNKHPNEVKAFQCKVVAMIRQEKYEDCLSLIRKNESMLVHVIFEKAYIEYRLNKIDDALKTLEKAESNDIRVQELKAQLYYRNENFTDSYNHLKSVIRNSQDDHNEERLTNLAAVAASAACFKNVNLDLSIQPNMYEGRFNMACYHIGLGNNKVAHNFLEEAKALYDSYLLENSEITEEEKNEELASIRVQEAYLLQLENKEEEANQIYQSVIRQRVSNNALLAVAANNVVCINREQNIFDSLKRIKMTMLDDLKHKLFNYQSMQMLINQALFCWHTNQMDACQRKLRTVLQTKSDSRALLLSVLQLVKDKHFDKAINILENHKPGKCDGGEKTNFDNLLVSLTLAQLHLRSDNLCTGIPSPSNAFKVAELMNDLLFESALHSPGVLSTRIALYLIASNGACTRMESLKLIANCIHSALRWHECSGGKLESYSKLLERCSGILLKFGEAKLAAELYEKQLAELNSQNQNNSELIEKQRLMLLARLVRAYAQFDRPKAELACKSLKLHESLSEADVNSLEMAFLYGTKSFKRVGKGNEQQTDPRSNKTDTKNKQITSSPSPVIVTPNSNILLEADKRKKRKKRKIRLPKNYQVGIMPDPNRWLPRRERANYRGKRKDKRYVSSRGPQGQIGGGSELDASTKSPKPAIPGSPHEENPNLTPGGGAKQTQQQHQRKGRKKGR